MKTKVFRIISILLLLVLILALGTLIAGAVAKANLAKQYPAPGQLVDVGGYKMHINCTGQGSPTVILEAGNGNYRSFGRTFSQKLPGLPLCGLTIAPDMVGVNAAPIPALPIFREPGQDSTDQQQSHSCWRYPQEAQKATSQDLRRRCFEGTQADMGDHGLYLWQTASAYA